MKSYHNKNKRAVRLWLLLPFLLMASVVEAQVTVDVRIDSLELWVGEQTRITLDVSTDTKSKLVMPQVKAGDMLTPGVEVVEVAKADTQQLNEGARRLVSQSYIVTSFDSALYYLPPLVVKVDGKEYQSKNLALRVLSIPVDTVHVDRFYGPKEIMAVPFSWTDWSLIFVLSVLLLVWVLGLAYFYIRYRDNKPIIKIIKLAPKVLPHTKAMEEIDQIKAEKSVERFILYAGKISSTFGVDKLVEGFLDAGLKDVKLVLCGDGDYTLALREKAANYPQIDFRGTVSHDTVLALEKSATLLVDPRPIDSEIAKMSFPSKIIEYMASATPVLVSNIPSFAPEYRQHQYRIEEVSAKGIENALREVFSHTDEELTALGASARQFILENKTIQKQCEKVIDLIRSVVRE